MVPELERTVSVFDKLASQTVVIKQARVIVEGCETDSKRRVIKRFR